MASPAEIVEGYFDAWTSKDFDSARSLLHDDLSFRGPIETLDNADALIESIKGLAQIVTGAERRTLLAHGDQVVVIYDLQRAAPTPASAAQAMATSPTVEARPPAAGRAANPATHRACQSSATSTAPTSPTPRSRSTSPDQTPTTSTRTATDSDANRSASWPACGHVKRRVWAIA